MTAPLVPNPRDMLRIRRARRGGIVNPLIAWQEARRAGLDYALLCAVLEQETGGGRNEFGHDPTIFVGAGPVTSLKYASYLKARRASGNRLMQGVGPMQLTWWVTQDAADALGGCWRERPNIRTGAAIIAYNVRRYGLHAGVKAYNGTGTAADDYARRVCDVLLPFWKKLLG